ncbi:MAG TPA: ribosome biogenesis factor YjgA [Xanthomonadales bacterium]|nr:ribosome biogenesis factor YjgA [Xanthomonadales bacterium]
MTIEPDNNNHFDEPPVEVRLISKSQLKRDALATKSLASELLGLNHSQLQRLPLDNDVLLAIRQARTIRSHGARRRQLQYIAKLLRYTDPSAIIEAVAGFQDEARGLTARQHRCEAWRDILLEKGDGALAGLLQLRPEIDAQALRQLVRNAQREHAAGKPPAAARALFRALRDIDAHQSLPARQ